MECDLSLQKSTSKKGLYIMKFGIIGLGRIGGNLSLQAIEKGHQVVGHSLSQKELNSLSQKGIVTAPTISDLVHKLKPPRIVFLYIPHGNPMDLVTLELMESLKSGDIVVDGGNSFWKKSVERYASFKERGIKFLDCGTSGGIEGARKGACFMVGGDKAAFLIVKPILHDLSAKDGFMYVESTGGNGVIGTRTIYWNEGELSLNVQAQGGDVRVQVTDSPPRNRVIFTTPPTAIPGYSFEDCIPFSGDDINWTPTWRDGKTLDALSGRSIRIEVQLNSSRLYAMRGDFVNMLGQQKRVFDNDGKVPKERPGF